MSRAIIAILGFVALITGAVQLLADSDVGAQDRSSQVKLVVAAQAAAEYGVRPGSFDGAVEAPTVQLESTGLVDHETHELIRASLPIDHAHPYLLLVGPGDLVLLGGFEEVQLSKAMTVLGIQVNDQESAMDAARSLTILADENGAEGLLVRFDDASAATVAQAWEERKPSSWPADTVTQGAGGQISVRLTVMSRRSHSYDQAWQPTTYQFEFSADGHLLGWARSIGEAFTA